MSANIIQHLNLSIFLGNIIIKSSNDIKIEGAKAIAALLKVSKSLSYLNLGIMQINYKIGMCYFSDEGCEEIGLALQKNFSLLYLSLRKFVDKIIKN